MGVGKPERHLGSPRGAGTLKDGNLIMGLHTTLASLLQAISSCTVTGRTEQQQKELQVSNLTEEVSRNPKTKTSRPKEILAFDSYSFSKQ